MFITPNFHRVFTYSFLHQTRREILKGAHALQALGSRAELRTAQDGLRGSHRDAGQIAVRGILVSQTPADGGAIAAVEVELQQ